MLEPDWDQPQPETTAAAVRALWQELRLARCADDGDPPAARLLEVLRKTHVNGGAAFASFSVASHPSFQWFISRNRWEEIELPERFLKLPTVVAALAEVCKDPVDDSFGFEWGSEFTLAGEIARTLADGGAYIKHEAGPGDAYAIADRFRQWLFGERFGEVLVLKSFKPWSAWFCGVAWDGTWLIVDKGQSKVSVLAVTDTD